MVRTFICNHALGSGKAVGLKFRLIKVPTDHSSDGSKFRRIEVPTDQSSDGSKFRRIEVPMDRSSDGSKFLWIEVPMDRSSDGSKFRQIEVPTERSLMDRSRRRKATGTVEARCAREVTAEASVGPAAPGPVVAGGLSTAAWAAFGSAPG
jgi:hypothetical protein